MTDVRETVAPEDHSDVLDRKPRLIPGPPLNPLLSGFFVLSHRFPEDDATAHIPVSYWDDDAKGVEMPFGKYVPANQQHWRPQCMSIQEAVSSGIHWHVLSRYYAKCMGAQPCHVCFDVGVV